MKKSISLFHAEGLFFFLMIISVFSGSCRQQQSPEMVLINGGTFIMGSPAHEYDRDFDEVQHTVTVSSFFIGIYEITQKEYQQIMRKNPSDFKGRNLPVGNVSWFDALNFCNNLSVREGLNPAYLPGENGIIWDRNANGYRLPTEAEWEYACRAGTESPFYTGDNISTDQANYDGNFPYSNYAIGKFLEQPAAAGSYPANAWGLYDMHGNVFEWCWDIYELHSHLDQIDPVGPLSGEHRVIKGGSWINSGSALRSAFRGIYFPGGGSDRIGFRVVRNAQ